METLRLVDFADRYIGIVTPLSVVDGVLIYGWTVSRPDNHFRSNTGTAKSEEAAISDAILAAAGLGIDGARVQGQE